MNFSHYCSRAGLALVAAGLIALLFLTTASAFASTQYVPGELVAKLKPDTRVADIERRYGIVKVRQFGSRPIYKFTYNDGRDPVALTASMASDSRLLFAEPMYRHGSPENFKDLPWIVNDPDAFKDLPWIVGGNAGAFANQWAASALKLPQAHAQTRGAGITIAVLDTGIDASHPVFAGKLVPGRDFVDGDNDPSEGGTAADAGFGHGTHVSGLALLAAPDARVMPLRVLGADGVGDIWTLAEAMMHAVDPDGNPYTPDGAQILNLSLGQLRPTELIAEIKSMIECEFDDDDEETLPGQPNTSQINNAIRCALHGGSAVFAAAGNSGNETQFYPAAEQGAIGIAATRMGGQLASFSTRGGWLSAAAPGEFIYGPIPGNGWAAWSGTSMASPLAAGVGALMKSVNRGLKPSDLQSKIGGSGQSINGVSFKLINADEAVRSVR